jgi:NDP-sugar pyrophosphorylase family protein
MKVVLLCGGIGKRMLPLVKDKALLKFAGVPLILQQINAAMAASLNHFVIIANSDNLADLKLAVAELENIKIDFGIQENPSGMADALLTASGLLAGEQFILVSVDDIVETSAYVQLTSEYEKAGDHFGYIIAHKVQNYFPGGYLVIDEDGEIRHIVEKPPRGKEPSNLINIVIHLHSHPEKLLDYLTRGDSKADDAYENALNQVIKDGHKIKAVLYNGGWQAIKYPWHILDAMDYFLKALKQRISPSAQISDKAIIDGDVVIEDNVRVLEGAVIRGPTYIGRNSIVGNNVLVRKSNIGDNCVIGYSTEVKHSYIGDGCWFHSNYIGDSVIEDGCSFGAGTITANFRLDETNIRLKVGDEEVDTGRDKLGALVGKGVRIGVNASLMPGVRVGAHSLVGAQVCLTSDLEKCSLALAESQYRILPNKTKPLEDKRQDLFKRLTE